MNVELKENLTSQRATDCLNVKENENVLSKNIRKGISNVFSWLGKCSLGD